MLKKILSKKIIIIIIVIAVLGFVIYNFFVKDGQPEYILERVSYGTVIKEVSETGAVKISEEINLSFKNSGRIDEMYVKVGDKVELGQELAKLDTSQLYIELTEAQAALEVVQADYNKLLAGSSIEEIKVAETEVLNTQIVLDNAEQSLGDVKADAQEDLNQAYEDALDVLYDAYLKLYNAYNVVNDIRRTYFSSSDQTSLIVKENKDKIKNAVDSAKAYIDEARADSQNEDIDTALSETKDAFLNTKEALEEVRNATEAIAYRDTVSDSDKTSLDNQKTYINTVYTNLVATQQDISSTKITNKTNINTAEASVFTAEAKLQKAQDELDLKKAGPTQENIDLYSAKIKQAQANVSLLYNKINEAVLKSPIQGQVTKINKREGEIVQTTDSVISFLPEGPFQVEVNIYEEDIVDVGVDNFVRISLPAFPGEVLEGRVISIDPAEKLIDGVVYYEVNIIFSTEKENIKPGMTADVIIETNKKENVLIISRAGLRKINGENIVRVFKKGKTEDRKIEIGLEGDEYVEVISGLAEGEEVIIGEKQE